MATHSNYLQDGSSNSWTSDLVNSIHSCAFCRVQEVDPSTQKRGWTGNPIPAIVIRYRGNKIIYGASQECLFFKHILNFYTEGEYSDPAYVQSIVSNIECSRYCYYLRSKLPPSHSVQLPRCDGGPRDTRRPGGADCARAACPNTE